MNLRLALVVWTAGMPGVVALAWALAPRLSAETGWPAQPWVMGVVGAAQSAAMLAMAAAAGAALAPRVGLRSPWFLAVATQRWPQVQWRRDLGAAVAGGLVGAGVIVAFHAFAPPQLAGVRTGLDLPLWARVLYGGVTEEILLRWGLMSLILWALWRLAQRGTGAPKVALVACAVAGSALAFGAGHLPVAAELTGGLTPQLGAYIVAGNALFGLVAGYLFWRHGLESAMLAHALAHVVASVLGS